MTMKPSLAIPFAIILGGIVVALAVYLSLRPPSRPPLTGDPALVRPVAADDHIFGNPAAPVMIVEYADFDCEYCKGFSDTLGQIVANEGADGSVAWVFRQFPLSEIHPNALKLAEATECAALSGGNEAFWKFSDELYAHQPADPSTFGALAASAGIPGDAFATCYQNASSTVAARITADRRNALDIGAQGTPYSLILVKGQQPVVLNGAYPYDAVKQIIDQTRGR